MMPSFILEMGSNAVYAYEAFKGIVIASVF